MTSLIARRLVLVLALLAVAPVIASAAEGEIRWGLHVTLAPKWLDLAFIWGVGPRVAESGAGLIPGFAYSAPFEDLRLK
jgi:hypothetical protein